MTINSICIFNNGEKVFLGTTKQVRKAFVKVQLSSTKMLLPAVLLIFSINYHGGLAQVQGAEMSGDLGRGHAAEIPFELPNDQLPNQQRSKRFIKQTGVSGRFVQKEGSTKPGAGSSPEGRAAAQKPRKRPPMMATAIGGRGSFAEEDQTPPPEEPQMGRSMSMSPQHGGRDAGRGQWAQPQPGPMGRSMGQPLEPLSSIFSSLELEMDSGLRQNVDDTDGANLNIGTDIAANLCALQEEFDATGSPPRHTLPEAGSRYLDKYKVKWNQGCYAFKWTPCVKSKRGSEGKPCGWYQLALC